MCVAGQRSLARALLVLTLAGATVACASRGERASRPGPQREPYLIVGDEMQPPGATNLYEVVQMQRPSWLNRTIRNRTGDAAIAVYLDERIIGSLNVLRDMPLQAAARLQYLSPTEAQLRFGPTHGTRAAIVVLTRRS